MADLLTETRTLDVVRFMNFRFYFQGADLLTNDKNAGHPGRLLRG